DWFFSVIAPLQRSFRIDQHVRDVLHLPLPSPNLGQRTSAFFWWSYAHDAYARKIFVHGACIAASGETFSIGRTRTSRHSKYATPFPNRPRPRGGKWRTAQVL